MANLGAQSNKGRHLELRCPGDEETLRGDVVLLGWLKTRFGGERVIVMYQEEEDCRVKRNAFVHHQVFLIDGRILRCDWVSPEHKGDVGTRFVSTTSPTDQ